ncbi:MAG: hypothetical protein NTX76_01700 [Alphaproteobacteria bacterium]|nr:hypothetical protein [Alphaproteobacteria bacterium]
MLYKKCLPVCFGLLSVFFCNSVFGYSDGGRYERPDSIQSQYPERYYEQPAPVEKPEDLGADAFLTLTQEASKITETQARNGKLEELSSIIDQINLKLREKSDTIPQLRLTMQTLAGKLNHVLSKVKNDINAIPFETGAFLYKALSNEGKKQFSEGGRRIIPTSLEDYARKSAAEKKLIEFKQDDLIILLIQKIESNHAEIQSRPDCLRKDRETLINFKRQLPADKNLGLFQKIDSYLGALQKHEREEPLLPIILQAIYGEARHSLSAERFQSLLEAVPSLQLTPGQPSDAWMKIKEKESEELVYPWINKQEQTAKAEEKKNVLDNTKDSLAKTKDGLQKTVQAKAGTALAGAQNAAIGLVTKQLGGLLGGFGLK